MLSRPFSLIAVVAVAAFSFFHSAAEVRSATYENIAFGGTNTVGALPAGGLVKGTDGNYYGTTPVGGAFDGGTVFRMTPDGVISTVVSFDFAGGHPERGVTVGTDGSLYGTTSGPSLGQANAHCTVFRVTLDGKLTTLASQLYKSGTPGTLPGMVTAGDDGNVYGVVTSGGAQKMGTVVRISPAGQWTVVVTFTGPNGNGPVGRLAKAADGSFYGSTVTGGANNAGTIFRVTTTGNFQTLLSFSNAGGGAPAGLTLGPDGTIYGVHGDTINGIVYKFTPGTGEVVNLAQLPQNYSGSASPVAVGDDGNLYGTTEDQFYRVTPAGELTVLLELHNSSAGRSPSGPLLKTGDGAFLCTLATGGVVSQNRYGTVERLSEQGTATPVCDFPPLLGRGIGQLSEIGGRLYGIVGDDGTPHAINQSAPQAAFSLSMSPNDPAPPTIFSFLFLGSYSGYGGSLVKGPDGDVYGVGSSGGYSDGSQASLGFIYSLGGRGIASNDYQFSGGLAGQTAPKGSGPVGSLTLGPDGQFYGTTEAGGVSDGGTFFRYDPVTQKLATLASFADATGSYPTGDLIFSDGFFYGRTSRGGENNTGTFFKVTPQGQMTTLASFEADRYTMGRLMLGDDGNFYASAQAANGTPNANASVLRLTKAGTLSTVTPLDKELGLFPQGLMQASDGNFYGVTQGDYNGLPGSIYRMEPNGTTTKLHTFSAAEGSGPVGSLIEGSDGYLYGSAAWNGPSGSGTIYRLGIVPPRLANISTRLEVQTGDSVSIGGFIVTGSASKKVLLRAIGPSLSEAGVGDVLADPVLQLHGPDGSIITQNDNWKQTQQAQIQATGVAPTNDLESALIADLAPGAYTAVVSGKNGGSGVGLVEVYDLAGAAGSSKLANISTRGYVDTGDNVMIGGVILRKGSTAKVIVRALGPSLRGAGVTDALADPTLELHGANGDVIASNDNWQDDPAQAAQISSSGVAPKDPLESAIATTLPPGASTAVVRGKSGAGVGLVEVYQVN